LNLENKLDCTEFNEKKEVLYFGLAESLGVLKKIGEEYKIEAIFSFSQGSLMSIFLNILIESEKEYKEIFKDLKCLILCSGFLDPYPKNKEILAQKEIIQGLLFKEKQIKTNQDDNFLKNKNHIDNDNLPIIKIPLMNVYGEEDDIIPKEKSKNIENLFKYVQSFNHPGKHFIPSAKGDIEKYILFLNEHLKNGN
jgi:predicted esterase